MKNIRCAFVTGGTGLLGINIARELLEHTSALVILLVRNATKSKRATLFNDLLAFNGGKWPGGFPYHRVEILEGDVTLPHLGIAAERRERLIKQIDVIYHSAAVIKLSGAEEEVHAVNVTGTEHVLDFALLCKQVGRLDKVIHVSTIAVSGDSEGTFYEDQLDIGQDFNNAYEKSKFQAEKRVEQYRQRGLNVLVVRPSMVIGHSQTGVTNNFNMFYFQLRLLSQGILDIIPLHKDARYNLIPVDAAAKAICLISYHPLSNETFHVVNSHEVNAGHILEKACDYLGYNKPALMPVHDSGPLPSTAVSGVRGRVLGMYYPYMNTQKVFNAANARTVLQPTGFAWPRPKDSLLTRIFDYCVLSGYLPLKNEVVNETRINHS